MFDDNPQVQSGPEQPQQSAQQPQVQEQPQSAQPEVTAAPQPPAEKPVKTTQEERMWSAIGYVAFLGVVTLAMQPKSEFCKKHASQGIVLFVIWFIGLIILALPIALVSGLGGILILGITVLAIIGIVKSLSSYEFKLPVLTDLAKMVPTGAIVGGLTGKTPPQGLKPQEDVPQQQEVQPTETSAPPATEEPKAETPAPQAAPEEPTPQQAPEATAQAEQPSEDQPQQPEENKPQESSQ